MLTRIRRLNHRSIIIISIVLFILSSTIIFYINSQNTTHKIKLSVNSEDVVLITKYDNNKEVYQTKQELLITDLFSAIESINYTSVSDDQYGSVISSGSDYNFTARNKDGKRTLVFNIKKPNYLFTETKYYIVEEAKIDELLNLIMEIENIYGLEHTD